MKTRVETAADSENKSLARAPEATSQLASAAPPRPTFFFKMVIGFSSPAANALVGGSFTVSGNCSCDLWEKSPPRAAKRHSTGKRTTPSTMSLWHSARPRPSVRLPLDLQDRHGRAGR